MASCVLDHASQLLVPDKAALCALSHTGIGNFQALAVLVFPKGMCQVFDDSPGHVLVSGAEDSVERLMFPLRARFADNRNEGIVFRCSQAVNGQAYVGFVDTQQVKAGPDSFNSLEDEALTWVRIELVVELSEVVNSNGVPTLTHVKEAMKKSPFMKDIKCTTQAAVSAFCAFGKFKDNIRLAWQLAEKRARKELSKGDDMNPADKQALKETKADLDNVYESLDILAPYYSKRLTDRIVFIDPQPPSAAVCEVTVAKLRGLLQHCDACSLRWQRGSADCGSGQRITPCLTWANLPKFVRHRSFPNNETILNAEKLQLILQAVNAGKGNLAAPTPIRLRSHVEASPSPPPAQHAHANLGNEAAPAPLAPALVCSPMRAAQPAEVIMEAQPNVAAVEEATSVVAATRVAGRERKQVKHYQAPAAVSKPKASIVKKPKGEPRGPRGSYKAKWMVSESSSTHSSKSTDSPVVIHRGAQISMQPACCLHARRSCSPAQVRRPPKPTTLRRSSKTPWPSLPRRRKRSP